jgi:hypothetical protein
MIIIIIISRPICNFTRYSRVGDEGAIAAAQTLRRHRGVKRISLASNGVSVRGGAALAQALEENTTLLELDLSDNPIHTGGVVASR